MPQKWLVLTGLVLAALLVGCNNDSKSDREEYAGVMGGEEGRALIPVNVPPRKGDTILGPIAASAEPPKAEKSDAKDAEAEEVKVDDSSAEAVAHSLVEIVKTGDFAKLPDVVPPEQSEQMGQMVAAYGPIAKAARQLKLAFQEKFPDGGLDGVFPISPTLDGLIAAELNVEVKSVSDEEATASFMVGPEATAKKIELTIKKFDQAWRVVLPDFAPPADIEATAKQDEGKDAAFADIAKRVESGDLKDVDAVKAQLTEVAAGTYKPAEGAEGSSESADQAKEAEAEPEQQSKKPRQRDAVDDVVSSPVLPRGG